MPNSRDDSRDLKDEASQTLTAPEVDADTNATPVKAIEGRTPWQLARARLRRDKPTMVAIGIATFMIVLALVAPLLNALNILNPLELNKELLDPTTLPKGAWGGISWDHPLGVEPGTGRDTMSRVILGLTFSLIIALSATIVAATLGTVLGLISGFLGRWPDFWISRVVDMTLAFPQFLMLLALSGMFIDMINRVLHNDNLSAGVYIIVVLGLFGWTTFARLVRGQVLSMREREFVEAAKSLGAKNARIYFKELLPNLWAPILVYTTLVLPAYVSAEAALSYLGVGIKPPTPTLGNILANSVNYAVSDPVYFLVPGLSIVIIVLSFNLVGDGLRDALDPKADR